MEGFAIAVIPKEIIGRIMVALDYSNAEDAFELVRKLEGIPCYMKVGMQLYYAVGPSLVRQLKEEGYKVFLDLKLHDIPNTVKGGAHSITMLGVDMFNVHAGGGLKMLQAALLGVADACAEDSRLTQPLVIGVTHLTSTSQNVLQSELGINLSMEDAVLKYAQLAKQAGLHGVVASPLEVDRIKQVCGYEFVTVTPGIRPVGTSTDDQSRVMTPQEAFAQGTNYIVIGRPITAAKDPRAALEKIMEELV